MAKQNVHTDLKRYLDYIERADIFQYMTDRQICQFVSSLQPGRAIVKLANGEQQICQFYPRESVHLSHTPQVQAAFNRYANLSFKPASFGAFIGDEEMLDEQIPVEHGHQCFYRTCHEPASHIYTFSTLRVTAKGKLSEEKYNYFCAKHANRQCKPIERV